MGGTVLVVVALLVATVFVVSAVAETSSSQSTDLHFSDFLGIDKADFLKNIYQDHMLIEKNGVFANKTIDIFSDLTNVIEFCETQHKVQHSAAGFQIKHNGKSINVRDCDHLNQALTVDGSGMVARYEDMTFAMDMEEENENSDENSHKDIENTNNNINNNNNPWSKQEKETTKLTMSGPPPAPVVALHEMVKREFGAESTVHLYHATQENSRALLPHTDPYDVIVLQIQGSKDWTTCVPNLNIDKKFSSQYEQHHKLLAHNKAEVGTDTEYKLSQAEKGQLQEIQKKRQRGCTRYEDEALGAYACEHFTLNAGDVMYLPKGVIHFATAGPQGSSHITISLEREGISWGDAVAYATTTLVFDNERSRILLSALNDALNSDFGVLLLNAMPIEMFTTNCAADFQLSSPSDEASDLYGAYSQMCNGLQPFVDTATASSINNNIAFSSLLGDDTDAMQMLNSVCSYESFQMIQDALCSALTHTLPVDVTSTSFAKLASRPSAPKRQKRSTDYGPYTCNNGCTAGCNVFNMGCDDSCTSTCICECTLCDDSCDNQICTSGCTSGCDDPSCDDGCTGSCNVATCTAGCDDSCNGSCDDNCNGGCTSSCDSSCDFFGFASCDSSCDSSCNICYSGCDTCYAGCDDSCTYSGCNTNCNTSCDFDMSCDEGCNTGCTPTDCDTSCDGPCSGCCTTTCTTGCDDPDPTSCNDACNTNCKCDPGFSGTGKSCTACKSGTYSTTPDSSSCTTCAGCNSGYYRYGCGESSAGKCNPCPTCTSGTFLEGCSGLNSGSCKPCLSNTYQPSQGSTSCLQCQGCTAGYSRSGCGGASPGTCIGIQCTNPPTVSYASISISNDAKYPSVATYTCSAGYMLQVSTENKLTCSTAGKWEGTHPVCVGVPCSPLSITHGSVSPTSSPIYPNTYAISCENGYEIQGQSSLNCRVDGTWSAQAPTCIGRICAAVDIPNHGSVSYPDGNRYPSKAVYTCDTGYYSSSSTTTRQCTTSGIYGGASISCLGVPCNTISSPDNGMVRFSVSPPIYPATADFSCMVGYMLDGQAKLQCQADKSWNAAVPTCIGVSCDIGSVDNGKVTTSSPRYPATASIACNPGYGLHGSNSLVCSTAGVYPSLPTCTLCAENSYAPSSTSSCLICPSGISTNGATGATGCLCNPGLEPFPSTNPQACSLCKDNFFQPSYSRDACQPCATGYETRDGDHSHCVGVVCDALPAVSHGKYDTTSSVITYPSTLLLTCELGFQTALNTSDESISCLTDGAWSSSPSCSPICGDGLLVEGEECDDGNRKNGDGCSSTCQLEDTHACITPGQPCMLCVLKETAKDKRVACDSPSKNSAITEWLMSHGEIVPFQHEQCSIVTYSDEVLFTNGSSSTGCYSATYKFSVDFNNHATVDSSIAVLQVYDVNAPTFNRVPSNSKVQCDKVPAFNLITATDTCMSSNPTVTKKEVRLDGSCTFAYNLTRFWTTTDECGNDATVSTVLEVVDTTIPTFTKAPVDKQIDCVADTQGAIMEFLARYGNAVATDNCDHVLNMTSYVISMDLNKCGGTGTVSYGVDATDDCNNSVMNTATITIVDNDEPIPVNLPEDITVSCAAIPDIPDDVIAHDECGSMIIPAVTSQERIDGACPFSYQLRRTFLFKDACDNDNPAVQIINVRDFGLPVFTREPEDIYLECHESNGNAINAWLARNGNAMALDDCSLDTLTWTNTYNRDDLVLDCGSTGTYDVLFIATDDCGLSANKTARIHISDSQPPVLLNVPDDIIVSCDNIPTPAQLVALDNCTETPTVTLDTTRINGECSSRYELIHRWTAVDECDNAADGDQIVMVTDNTAPVLLQDASDVDVECNLEKNEDNFMSFLSTHGGAMSGDSCTEVQWFYSDVSSPLDPSTNSSETQNGEVTKMTGCSTTFSASVLFYAADTCGNFASTNASFTISDTQPPVFQDAPSVKTKYSCDTVPEQPEIEVVDVCAGSIPSSKSEVRVDGKCPFTYVLHREWVATDACNHTTTFAQLVEVVDTTPPLISVEARDLVLECNQDTNDMEIANWLSDNGGARSVDACSGNTIVWSHDYENVKGALERGCGNNAVNVTFHVHDECGNPAKTIASITINDEVAPVVTKPAVSQVQECHKGDNQQQLTDFISLVAGATASDACTNSSNLVWTHSVDVIRTCGAALINNFTFTVWDSCGHTAHTYATLEFKDSTPPQATLNGGNPQISPINFPWQDPSVFIPSDSCHGSITLIPTVSGTVDADVPGDYPITYTITDVCGNTNHLNRTVRVIDNIPPYVTVHGTRIFFLRVGSIFRDLSQPISVSDNFDASPEYEVFTLRNGGVDTDIEAAASTVGTTHVVYRASDGTGNTRETLGRVLHVLAVTSGQSDTVTIDLLYDFSSPISSSSSSPSTMLSGWYVFDVILAIGVTKEHFLANFDFISVFGQSPSSMQWGVPTDPTSHVSVRIVMNDVTLELLTSAVVSSSLIVAVSEPQRVLDFQNTVITVSSCDVAGVRDYLVRTGRNATSALCTLCPVCEYASATPPRGDSYDAPRVAESAKWNVVLTSKKPGEILLKGIVEDDLFAAGIFPTNLVVSGTNATFTTRSRLIVEAQSNSDFPFAVVSTTLFTHTQLTITPISQSVRRQDIHSSLLSSGIVAESIQLPTNESEYVIVTTLIDVTPWIITLLETKASIVSVAPLSYPSLAAFDFPQFSYTYSVMSIQNAIHVGHFPEMVLEAFARVSLGGHGEANCTSVANLKVSCDVAWSHPLSNNNITAIQTQNDNIESVEFTADISVEAQVRKSILEQLVAMVPYPSDHMSVHVMSPSRRRSEDMTSTDILVSMSVTSSAEEHIIGGSTAHISDYGDQRFVLEFDLQGVDDNVARERAIFILDEAFIPTVSVEVTGHHVRAIVLAVLRDEHLAIITNDVNVVTESVTGTVSTHSFLKNVDVVFVIESLVNNGQLRPTVDGQTFALKSFTSSAYGQHSASSSSFTSSHWPIVIGVLIAIIAIVLIAFFVVVRLYRNKPTIQLDLAENDNDTGNRTVFTNPLYDTARDTNEPDETADFEEEDHYDVPTSNPGEYDTIAGTVGFDSDEDAFEEYHEPGYIDIVEDLEV
eukprot:m.115075 g.115075  ORF g.115075 m.115075 type:complete len:3091 (-) comp9287_c0_seq2:1834-11106(-)